MHFHPSILNLNQIAFPENTRVHEVPESIAWGYHNSVYEHDQARQFKLTD